jgi:hypothetical protein
MEAGGEAVQVARGIAEGRKHDWGGGSRDFGSLKSVVFLHEESVQGRGIMRHNEVIAQVLAYKVIGELHDCYVLVYLTPEGLLADIDVANE